MASYTLEDKIRIIRRVLEDGESKSFVAASEGCERHTIDAWISRYKKNREAGLMTIRGYSKHPDSLKTEIIQYKNSHYCTANYLAKRFNVPVSTVKRWITNDRSDSTEQSQGELQNTNDAKENTSKLIAQLIKENQRLRMENEILKKAKASIR